MPIYEYRCESCGQVSSFFTRSIGSPLVPICSHCSSPDMQRRMSSFAMSKTPQTEHDGYQSALGAASQDYYSDPRNIGRNVEEGFRRYGMEMPKGVRDTLEAAREGDLPKRLDV